MKIRIGVAIARKCGDLSVVEVRRGKAAIHFERHVDRGELESPSFVLEALLSRLPPEFGRSPLHIALSWGEFACADSVRLPGSIKPQAIAKVAPGLCESRSAGEALEDLSIDALTAGEAVHALALRSEVISGIATVARIRGTPIALVTATPIVLAHVLGEGAILTLVYGGERTAVMKKEGLAIWRSCPVDRATWKEGGEIRPFLGLRVAPNQAAAVAAALADPLLVPNILRGGPDAPRSFGARFRSPLLALGAAAALFVLSLGLYFRAAESRVRREESTAIAREADLWKKFLPDRPRKEGELLRSMKEVLKEAGVAPSEGDFPSALLFWADIARHLPEVDPIGMTLESLDLTPEGGRLFAVVSTVPGDPLRNAALLEGRLCESDRMVARGDYEAREKDVQVRLKMDYRKNAFPAIDRPISPR